MPLQETQQREVVVACARSLLPKPLGLGPVPWRHMGRTRAGLDCGGELIFVFQECGHAPADFETGYYSPDFMVHRDEERFVGFVETVARCVSLADRPARGRIGPPGELKHCRCGAELTFSDSLKQIHAGSDIDYSCVRCRPPRNGDVALFRVGRLIAHCAIVDQWPRVIHAVCAGTQVCYDEADNGPLKRRFQGLWSLKEWT